MFCQRSRVDQTPSPQCLTQIPMPPSTAKIYTTPANTLMISTDLLLSILLLLLSACKRLANVKIHFLLPLDVRGSSGPNLLIQLIWVVPPSAGMLTLSKQFQCPWITHSLPLLMLPLFRPSSRSQLQVFTGLQAKTLTRCH